MGEDNILAKMVADITGIDYYILEDKNEKPVANIKLITNKKGNVIRVEVINGK